MTASGGINAILAFNRSNASRFDGAVSGTGSIQNLGTGITTLTGTNTNTGVTTISAGGLQLGDPAVNSGTTGSLGTAGITNNGTLIFNRSDDVNTPIPFPNVISGTGGITKNGASAVTAYRGQHFYRECGRQCRPFATELREREQCEQRRAHRRLGRFAADATTRTVTVNAGAALAFIVNNIFGNQN